MFKKNVALLNNNINNTYKLIGFINKYEKSLQLIEQCENCCFAARILCRKSTKPSLDHE